MTKQEMSARLHDWQNLDEFAGFLHDNGYTLSEDEKTEQWIVCKDGKEVAREETELGARESIAHRVVNAVANVFRNSDG